MRIQRENFAASAFAGLLLLAGLALPVCAQEDVTVTIETHFSPNRKNQRPIQDAWLRELGKASSSIRVAMYSFTLQPYKSALIEAMDRGVDVRVLADRSGLYRGSAPSCLAVDLFNAGIPIKVYAPFYPSDLLHDKFMLIDDSVLVTGSANFTTAAVQYNHENSIIIKKLGDGDTPQFIASYRDQFESMWNDEFADFNGHFDDWKPEGTCQ